MTAAKIGIMQPYFFPYMGYFSLIKHVDRFILFDTVQFIRHGWIDRNRVLKQGDGWIYIRPTLKSDSKQVKIRDICVDESQPWKQRLLDQLAPYKRVAPHYWKVRKLVEQVITPERKSLVELNKATLEAVCSYLDMPRTFEVFSRMNLLIDPPNAPDEWALNICKALGGVTEYWNPPNGESFFDRTKYELSGINLRFLRPRLIPYNQERTPFEAWLSIIDVLMFNTSEQTHVMLDAYDLA